jgi:hypothetical protein
MGRIKEILGDLQTLKETAIDFGMSEEQADIIDKAITNVSGMKILEGKVSRITSNIKISVESLKEMIEIANKEKDITPHDYSTLLVPAVTDLQEQIVTASEAEIVTVGYARSIADQLETISDQLESGMEPAKQVRSLRFILISLNAKLRMMENA